MLSMYVLAQCPYILFSIGLGFHLFRFRCLAMPSGIERQQSSMLSLYDEQKKHIRRRELEAEKTILWI